MSSPDPIDADLAREYAALSQYVMQRQMRITSVQAKVFLCLLQEAAHQMMSIDIENTQSGVPLDELMFPPGWDRR